MICPPQNFVGNKVNLLLKTEVKNFKSTIDTPEKRQTNFPSSTESVPINSLCDIL